MASTTSITCGVGGRQLTFMFGHEMGEFEEDDSLN